MERKREIETVRHTSKLPRIVVPTYIPPTPEELTRRRALGKEADRIRGKIGPLRFSLTDLIREDRESR